MSKDIKLRSRYGDMHTLEHMPGEGENVYRYVPAKDWMCMRYGFTDKFDTEAEINELLYADTDGGPFISEGFEVEGRKVKRIYDKKGVGCLVELE